MSFDFQGLTIFFVLFSFDGRVVAKLPFVPISWFQGLSHRDLPCSDYTDCSFIFLYILCTMSISRYVIIPGVRYQLLKLNSVLDITTNIYFLFLLQNIQKVLCFTPSRAVNKAPGFLIPALATK